MVSLKFVPLLALLAGPVLAQTYGIGRAPSSAELAAADITIKPNGAGLPAGRGTAAEGAILFKEKNCATCHGEGAVGGVTAAPRLKATKGPEVNAWDRGWGGNGLPVKAPSATITWDFINRGMPLGNEGSLTPNEVYALTAYLFAINQIIPEDMVLDQDNLAKVKMPIGDNWARVPDWKPPKTAPRLPNYPF